MVLLYITTRSEISSILNPKLVCSKWATVTFIQFKGSQVLPLQHSIHFHSLVTHRHILLNTRYILLNTRCIHLSCAVELSCHDLTDNSILFLLQDLRERERERERERRGGRGREIDRQREGGRETDRQTEGGGQTDRQTEI